MADPSPPPESMADAETGAGPGVASDTGAPRWVKVFLIIALAVVLLFVVLQAAGVGGDHGPGRHGGGGRGDAPSSSVTEHRPPPGGHAP